MNNFRVSYTCFALLLALSFGSLATGSALAQDVPHYGPNGPTGEFIESKFYPGRVYVRGTLTVWDSTRTSIARLLADGSLDASFRWPDTNGGLAVFDEDAEDGALHGCFNTYRGAPGEFRHVISFVTADTSGKIAQSFEIARPADVEGDFATQIEDLTCETVLRIGAQTYVGLIARKIVDNKDAREEWIGILDERSRKLRVSFRVPTFASPGVYGGHSPGLVSNGRWIYRVEAKNTYDRERQILLGDSLLTRLDVVTLVADPDFRVLGWTTTLPLFLKRNGQNIFLFGTRAYDESGRELDWGAKLGDWRGKYSFVKALPCRKNDSIIFLGQGFWRDLSLWEVSLKDGSLLGRRWPTLVLGDNFRRYHSFVSRNAETCEYWLRSNDQVYSLRHPDELAQVLPNYPAFSESDLRGGKFPEMLVRFSQREVYEAHRRRVSPLDLSAYRESEQRRLLNDRVQAVPLGDGRAVFSTADESTGRLSLHLIRASGEAFVASPLVAMPESFGGSLWAAIPSGRPGSFYLFAGPRFVELDFANLRFGPVLRLPHTPRGLGHIFPLPDARHAIVWAKDNGFSGPDLYRLNLETGEVDDSFRRWQYRGDGFRPKKGEVVTAIAPDPLNPKEFWVSGVIYGEGPFLGKLDERGEPSKTWYAKRPVAAHHILPMPSGRLYAYPLEAQEPIAQSAKSVPLRLQSDGSIDESFRLLLEDPLTKGHFGWIYGLHAVGDGSDDIILSGGFGSINGVTSRNAAILSPNGELRPLVK